MDPYNQEQYEARYDGVHRDWGGAYTTIQRRDAVCHVDPQHITASVSEAKNELPSILILY